jgi:hypothetical protein
LVICPFVIPITNNKKPTFSIQGICALSSILKALNRLKNEAPKQDETPSWPQEIDMKRAVRRDRKWDWLFNKLVYAIAAVVIVAGTGWLVYSQKPHVITRMLPWAVSSKEVPDKKKAEVRSDRSKSAKTVVSVRKKAAFSRKPTDLRKKAPPPRNLFQKGTLARKAPQESGASRSPGEASAKRPASLKRRQDLSARRQSRTEARLSGPGLSPKRMTSEKQAQKTGSPVTSSRRAPVPAEPAEDSKFRLQAIAWSDDAKKRVAVINDHVVKEGASVEGARVTHIGRDEVIVRDGGKDYKLVFGLR